MTLADKIVLDWEVDTRERPSPVLTRIGDYFKVPLEGYVNLTFKFSVSSENRIGNPIRICLEVEGSYDGKDWFTLEREGHKRFDIYIDECTWVYRYVNLKYARLIYRSRKGNSGSVRIEVKGTCLSIGD